MAFGKMSCCQKPPRYNRGVIVNYEPTSFCLATNFTLLGKLSCEEKQKKATNQKNLTQNDDLDSIRCENLNDIFFFASL